MWRIIRFAAGAFALFLVASQGSAQRYSDNCQTCDFGTGEISLHQPICLAVGAGDPGNSHCQTRISTDYMHRPTIECLYLGDACIPSPPLRIFEAYWGTQFLFGFMASSTGVGCCGADNIDWCTVWGMPAGCT